MKKETPIVVLVLTAGWFFFGQAVAEEISPPSFVKGAITKVDSGKKEIAVRTEEGEMLFHWNPETRVNGSLPGKGSPISEELKEGTLVTIFFMEADRSRTANRIEVEAGSLGDRKGWMPPFACGTRVC